MTRGTATADTERLFAVVWTGDTLNVATECCDGNEANIDSELDARKQMMWMMLNQVMHEP